MFSTFRNTAICPLQLRRSLAHLIRRPTRGGGHLACWRGFAIAYFIAVLQQ